MRDFPRANTRPLWPNHRLWTEFEIAELKRRHNEGQTFSEISAALHKRTRNACISKANKLDLPPRNRADQCRRGFDLWRRGPIEIDRFMEGAQP